MVPGARGAATVRLIGAGASGVTVATSPHRRGISFDWLEKGSALGGSWRHDNGSRCDIAVDLARVAEQVYLSTRPGLASSA